MPPSPESAQPERNPEMRLPDRAASELERTPFSAKENPAIPKSSTSL